MTDHPQQLTSSMEDVDGGSKKVVKKRRQRKTKKPRKNKKNKSLKKK